MSIKKLIIMLCAVCVAAAFGQTAKYPFPGSAVVYPNGYKPATLTGAKAKSWYDSWKSESLKPCAGKGLMPTADNSSQVKVEGMGWAMIASAYMGDKETFDGLYQFYNSKTGATAGGMMAWDVSCDGVNDQGSASDGDLDVGFALVVASWQWNGTYLDSARAVINRCKQLITACEGLSVIAGGFSGGAWGGGCNYTDISYYTPAFFRVFAQVTSDAAWTKLADDTYTHLERNAHATTGIVSDWQSVRDGKPFKRDNANRWQDTTYSYDASRVPWRITLDYLWNGNEKAKAWATKISGWANGQLAANNLKNGHLRNGSSSGDGGNAEMAFLGGWAVSAMANSQAAADAFGTALANRNDSYWYHRHTGNMYLLALTGNMWNEDLVNVSGFKLTSAVDGGGTITRVPDKTKYAAGETVKLTAKADNGWDFAGWTEGVAADDAAKKEITVTMSADKSVKAKFQLSAGVNLVKNGDFSQGTDGLTDWALNQGDNYGKSGATAKVTNGAVTVNITKLPESGNIWDIQLVQASLPLLKGSTYVVSFEASAEVPRAIQVMCQKASGDWATYFSENVDLTTAKTLYSFEFTMDSTSDDKSRIGFNVAQSNKSVTISNVSVTFKSSTSAQSGVGVAYGKNIGMRVTAAKSAINVKFNARSSGSAQLRLYSIKGKLMQKVSLPTAAGKSYAHAFDAAKLPSGFYVVGLRDGNLAEHVRVLVSK